MSDAVRLYQTVYLLIATYLPDFKEEHKITLSEMITGILRSNSVQFRQIAEKVDYDGKNESLVDKFRRFVRNKNIPVRLNYLPFVHLILNALQGQELVLIMDSSKAGGRCICLMLSLYYKGRALPLCWTVAGGRKGHSSAHLQLEIVKYIAPLLAKNAKVTFLGDGEFDSTELISWLKEKNWRYVCRTATNIKVFYNKKWINLKDLKPKDGETGFLNDVLFTEKDKIKGVNIAIYWCKKHKRHAFLVTNTANFAQSQKWYRLRFTIETFFSDVKKRGFNLAGTRLYHPERVSRLMLGVSIAYIFTIFLGTQAIVSSAVASIARPADSWYDTYYSLFQLGLIYLDHLLNRYLSIPIICTFPKPNEFHHGSVI